MDIPGEIYKTDDGLCFVPGVRPACDEFVELMKFRNFHCLW